MATTKPASPYRALQQRCKAAGLPANLTAAELKQSLQEYEATHGEVTVSTQPTASPARSRRRSSSRGPAERAGRGGGGGGAGTGAGSNKATASSMGGDDDAGCLMGLWPDGFAGVSSKGIFNALPSWVNGALPPGYTSQVEQLGMDKTLETIVKLNHLFWSPNLVWLAMAVAVHVFAPYDFEAAKEGFAADWLIKRFLLNYAVAFVYYGFFFAGLYVFELSGRKYLEDSHPTVGNMLHNMWYWSLGIVQWTFWEAVMVRLWATGAVDYASWDQIKNDNYLLALNIFWIVAIPIWRDIHFYIAHRFLHIRSIYTYVHKLHHRNADPEPFSGMTMHPVEHLYYFSNAFTPSLYMSGLSPLIFTWNFIHLTIAPGAGHSGWEDHFQSDQYHYIHHAKFEANYGSPMSGCVDQMLGTFRETLGKSKVYKGEWSEKFDDNAEAVADIQKQEGKKIKVWAPHSYLGFPASWDHLVYTIFWAAMFPVTWYGITDPKSLMTFTPELEPFVAQIVAGLVAYSAVPLAVCLAFLSGDRMSWRWPFQKESIFGVFGLFVTLAWLACIVPVYHATLWTVQRAYE